MKTFLKKIGLFLLPVGLVLCSFLFLLWHSGDLNSVQDILLQNETDTYFLYGPAYVDPNPWYKYQRAKFEKAQVLVVGTSRSMQFSSAMFHEGTHFYNAGGAIRNLYEIEGFLQAMGTEALPKTLILGLDQYFFNAEWAGAWSGESTYTVSAEIPQINMFGYAWPQLMRDFAKGKYNPFKVLTAPSAYVGLNAKVNNRGFWPDGSYSYGSAADDLSKGEDAGFKDTFRRIDTGTNRFQYGSEVSADSLAALQSLLAYCHSQGIQVVAYLPPYAPSVFARMQESGNYTYMDKIYAACTPIFALYNASLYDFTNMPLTSDEMYLDGFHAGDKVYAAMMAEMCTNMALKPYTDGSEALLSLFYANTQNPRVLN
ncbi:MAG: hypothetical protein PHG02_02320 [Oscillospiraceae bacterium]|nr:hypothetical protein [Oscillospiraceae bacterium]